MAFPEGCILLSYGPEMLHFVLCTDYIQYFYFPQLFLLLYFFHLNILHTIYFNDVFPSVQLLLVLEPCYPFNFKIFPSPHPSLLSVPPLTLTRFLSLHCKTASTIILISFRGTHSGNLCHLATEDNVLTYVLPSKS